MSKVKRWYIGVYGGEAQARGCTPHAREIIRETQGEIFVLDADFERVDVERDALQQRLTAADERVDVLEGLLKRARHRIANLSRAPVPFDDPLDGPVLHGIDDALCAHQYAHFGTEQPRRRCNLCNKLEPMSAEQVAAFNDDNDHRPERDQ